MYQQRFCRMYGINKNRALEPKTVELIKPNKIENSVSYEAIKDFIPIHFYAKESGRISFAFTEKKDYKGYLNQKGDYEPSILVDDDFYVGQYVFSVLVSIDSYMAKGSRLMKVSYWDPVYEKSEEEVIDAAYLSTGVPTHEKKMFSLATGWLGGLTEDNEEDEPVLVRKQEDSIMLQEQIVNVLDDTEEWTKIYQSKSRYTILQGYRLSKWLAYLNGNSTDEAKYFSSLFDISFSPVSYDFNNNYFIFN